MKWVIICIMLVVLFLLVGIPVAFGFGIITGFLFYIEGMKFIVIPQSGFHQVTSFTILAVPFFLYLGDIMLVSDSIKPLINFSKLLVGKTKVALGNVSVVTNIFFGAITGSGVAATTATGAILFPSLREEGYDKNYASALIASSGSLGFLIPPSVPLIVFSSVVDGASIQELFLGGIVPGLLLAFSFMITNRFFSRIETTVIEKNGDSFDDVGNTVLKIIIRAIPALLLPIIILGGIYTGLFSPTEAAAIGCVYAIIIGFLVYRKLTWRKMFETSKTSAVTIAVVLFLLFVLIGFGRILVVMNIPQELASMLTSLVTNKTLLLFMVALLLIILGMLMDAISGTLVVSPLLLPLMTELGISVTHYGIIMCTAFSVGLITPPVCPSIYVMGRIANTEPTAILKYIGPFFLSFIVVLMLVLFIPALSEFLPNLLLK